jgi:DNA-binding MarR family transcriptional regulator
MRNKDDNVNQVSDVLDLVHHVMHQVRSQQYQVLRDGPHDVTHMESKVMHFFGHHPGATQSELAQKSGRDKAQLARLIKGLRERGLLDGEAGEADRRSVRLQLTEAGRAVLRTLQQQARRVHARAVAEMSAEEQQRLIALLQQVSRNLEK